MGGSAGSVDEPALLAQHGTLVLARAPTAYQPNSLSHSSLPNHLPGLCSYTLSATHVSGKAVSTVLDVLNDEHTLTAAAQDITTAPQCRLRTRSVACPTSQSTNADAPATGYPGIPPGAPDRPQAAVKGVSLPVLTAQRAPGITALATYRRLRFEWARQV